MLAGDAVVESTPAKSNQNSVGEGEREGETNPVCLKTKLADWRVVVVGEKQ